jgi:hypothetical protein
MSLLDERESVLEYVELVENIGIELAEPPTTQELIESFKNPHPQAVIIDIIGPTARIEMLAERMPHSEVMPLPGTPDEAHMWLIGVFGNYVSESRSGSPSDFFYFHGPNHTGDTVRIAVEAEYLVDAQLLSDEA